MERSRTGCSCSVARRALLARVDGHPLAGPGVVVLEARGLRLGWPQAGEVLRGVNVTLRSGERIRLVGDNGSGKSVLLRALAWLEPGLQGSVALDGVPLGGEGGLTPTTWRRRVQLVPQVPVMLPGTVDDNLRAAAGPDGDEAAAVARGQAVVRALGHTFSGEQEAQELSGGQRAVLALARALALEPAVLLLDEPEAALDQDTHERLKDLLEARAEDGLAVLWVSHQERGEQGGMWVVSMDPAGTIAAPDAARGEPGGASTAAEVTG